MDMKNFIKHVVFSHYKGLRWYFKSTIDGQFYIISLRLSDIKLLRYGLFLLIPPFKITHIKGNWD